MICKFDGYDYPIANDEWATIIIMLIALLLLLYNMGKDNRR